MQKDVDSNKDVGVQFSWVTSLLAGGQGRGKTCDYAALQLPPFQTPAWATDMNSHEGLSDPMPWPLPITEVHAHSH